MAEKKQPVSATKIVNKDERKLAFESACLHIEKQFGKGVIQKLGADSVIQGVSVIPSGSLILDRALGVGGFPRGRIIEIYGPESSGKTTIALHAIAEAQKQGGTAAFIDAEHAIDPIYAKNIGVDVENLWVSQPDNGEQALEVTEQLVRSGAVDIIVIDSVAALTPKAEISGLMGDSQIGTQARLMSQALRKLTSVISKTSCCLIFINQIRMKIGVMFGSPEVTSGGNALKFYASIRLDIRRTERISQGADNIIGNGIRIKVAKNKVAPPFKVADMAIYFGKGISKIENILDLSVELGHITKAGSWYSIGDERLGQGKESVVKVLEEKEELCAELEIKIRKEIFPDREGDVENAGSTDKKASSTDTQEVAKE